MALTLLGEIRPRVYEARNGWIVLTNCPHCGTNVRLYSEGPRPTALALLIAESIACDDCAEEVAA